MATDVVVDALGDTAVEVVFPEGGSVSELCCSGWSGSWGLMPLAARQTAISLMRAVLGWLPGGAQTGWASAWLAWSWTWSARSVTSWDRFAR